MRVASKVGTFIPNLGTLGLWVLELFAMYATDGQTDGRTDGQKQRLLPLPYDREHNKKVWPIPTRYGFPLKVFCQLLLM